MRQFESNLQSTTFKGWSLTPGKLKNGQDAIEAYHEEKKTGFFRPNIAMAEAFILFIESSENTFPKKLSTIA